MKIFFPTFPKYEVKVVMKNLSGSAQAVTQKVVSTPA
jgi:hypothetical protein